MFVFVASLMPYLYYLCVLVYSGVEHILCFCFVCLRLVYPVLPVSLDCSLLIVPSIFSKHLFRNCNIQYKYI